MNAVRGSGFNRLSHRHRGDAVADLNPPQSTPGPGPAPTAVRHADYLLIGGGLAAATAAETLRQEGAEGSIAIVCDEPEPPYHRPPLSTRFLQPGAQPPFPGAQPPFPGVLDAAFYRDNDVTLLKGVRALALDCAARRVDSESGAWRYDQLLIATGVRPLLLDAPGAHLVGVHTLRTVATNSGAGSTRCRAICR